MQLQQNKFDWSDQFGVARNWGAPGKGSHIKGMDLNSASWWPNGGWQCRWSLEIKQGSWNTLYAIKSGSVVLFQFLFFIVFKSERQRKEWKLNFTVISLCCTCSLYSCEKKSFSILFSVFVHLLIVQQGVITEGCFFFTFPQEFHLFFFFRSAQSLDLEASACLKKKNPLGEEDVNPPVLYTSAASSFKHSNNSVKLSHRRRKHICRMRFILSPQLSGRRSKTSWEWADFSAEQHIFRQTLWQLNQKKTYSICLNYKIKAVRRHLQPCLQHLFRGGLEDWLYALKLSVSFISSAIVRLTFQI